MIGAGETLRTRVDLGEEVTSRDAALLGWAEDRVGFFVLTTTAGDRHVLMGDLAVILGRLRRGEPVVDEAEQLVFVAPEHVVSLRDLGDPK